MPAGADAGAGPNSPCGAAGIAFADGSGSELRALMRSKGFVLTGAGGASGKVPGLGLEALRTGTSGAAGADGGAGDWAGEKACQGVAPPGGSASAAMG